MFKNKLKISLLSFCIFLYACTPPDLQTNTQLFDTHKVNDFYQKAQKSGKHVYKIDTQQSQAIIYVYKGGVLAKLGHNHVVANYNLSGYILDDVNQVQADITAPLDLLIVDESSLRVQAGFVSQPTTRDIEGTKQHMLEPVLEAEQYPVVHIHVNKLMANTSGFIALVEFTLHGVTQLLEVPINIKNLANKKIKISGKFSINQTDFGIKPYAVMGGLLQVQDKVDLTFIILAAQ